MNLFFKEQKYVNSRSARPSTSYPYIQGLLKRKGLHNGTVQYLGRDHGQLPTPLLQKWWFSHEKNRLLATVPAFGTFLEIAVTLDWHIFHIYFTSS